MVRGSRVKKATQLLLLTAVTGPIQLYKLILVEFMRLQKWLVFHTNSLCNYFLGPVPQTAAPRVGTTPTIRPQRRMVVPQCCCRPASPATACRHCSQDVDPHEVLASSFDLVGSVMICGCEWAEFPWGDLSQGKTVDRDS